MWPLIWFNLGLSYYYIYIFSRMRCHLIFLPPLFFFPTIFWVYQICSMHHFKFTWIIYFRKDFKCLLYCGGGSCGGGGGGLVAKSCPTLETPWTVACEATLSMGFCRQEYCLENGVGCYFLLQGIFQTRESNPGLLHCRQILYQLTYKGSPFYNSIKFALLEYNMYLLSMST